jgi:hypothetical protein
MLSKYIFAPDNSGFTHPLKTQFTHFKAKGNYDFFGLSCKDLNKIMSQFCKEFIQESKSTFKDHTSRREFTAIIAEVGSTVDFINGLLQALKSNTIYESSSSISTQVIETGHIPIMLKSIAPASGYQIAARRVSSADIEVFFQRFPNASQQGREYCVKTDMMARVAKLRKWVVETRYLLNANDPLIILCNKLIMNLDTKIIAENQKHLPPEYEQFDLYDTFVEKVYELTCRLDITKQSTKTLVDQIMGAINTQDYDDITVSAQQKLATHLYELLIKYVNYTIGLGNESGSDVELTEEQDAMLQNVLPLIAYLNSTANPFSRNGLFGKEITNAFHREALNAYKDHESKEKCWGAKREYCFKQTPASQWEFNGEQIEHLLDGKKASKQQIDGILGALSNFLLLANASSTGTVSQSAERRAQLALPAPREYTLLMITDGTTSEERKTNMVQNNNS